MSDRRVRAWLRRRRPLWAIFPTRRAAAAVAATAPLWLLPGTGGFAAASTVSALVVLALVVDYVLLPGRRAVTATWASPETIGLGDPASIDYTLASRWWWPVRVELLQRLPPTLDAPRRVTRTSLESGESITVSAPFDTRQRGRYALGPIGMRLTTALGLLVRIVHADRDDTLLVVPSFTNVRRFRLLALHRRLHEAGVRSLRQRGEGLSLSGLRPYVPGDDPRRIDWKATARHRSLITRELTIERAQQVMLLIDCGRAMTQQAGRFQRLDHVLAAALVLADVAVTSGDRVGLLAFDDSVRAFAPPTAGRASVRRVRELISGLEPTMSEPDYASAFRLLATRQRRRALIVFFTDIIDARVARSLVAHATRSVERHVVVLVAIRNDALLDAARPTQAGALAFYRSAAAEELIREREEALARLRHAGVTVLDVSPGEMTAAAVNRYLEIKSRGLL